MRALLFGVLFSLFAEPAMAEESESGKIVWDVGVVSKKGKFLSPIDEVEIVFTSVIRNDDGDVVSIGDTHSRRHILNRYGKKSTTTFRDLNLPVGAYILGQVAFRETLQGQAAYREYNQTFCLMEKTILVDVEPGKTKYIGQLQFNEPSGSPQKDARSYVPIHGMAFDLAKAQRSKHWKFGDAEIADIVGVSVDPNLSSCGPHATNVAAW